MLNFITSNLPTILVGAIVFLIVGAVCVKLALDVKHHKSSCGCGCAGCPSSGGCHGK